MTRNESHKIRWFVVVDGERIPRQSSMSGKWDYDATCSCGWATHTGGALENEIRRQIADHKWDVECDATVAS
jgi:hypothetical protein